MQLDRVNCNGCGAMLEITPTTNFVTCGVCSAPLTVRRTGTSIFTEPVEHISQPVPLTTPSPASPHEQLQLIQRQQEINRLENQLNRLDIDWERAKEQYMVSGRYGARYLPKKGSSVAQGVVIGVFGAFWVVMASGITTGFTWNYSADTFGPPPLFRILFPLAGVVVILFGIGWSINAYAKADEYEQAQQRYLNRKAQLRTEIAKARQSGG